MKIIKLFFYPIKILGLKVLYSLLSNKKYNCINCSSDNVQLFKKYNYFFNTLKINYCTNCSSYQLYPILNQLGFNLYYKYLYRIDYLLISKNHLFQRELRRGRYICNYLIQNNIKLDNKKVFEIGSGCGGILSYFNEEFNCDVSGIDLDNKTVKYAKKKKINLICSDYKDFKILYKYDLIILSHVLEHIKEIDNFLVFIKNLCHEKTIIYIEVPGIDNIRVKKRKYSIQPGHLHYFNEKNLISIFKRNNLNIIGINNSIQSIISL